MRTVARVGGRPADFATRTGTYSFSAWFSTCQ